jgi:hypothetical protein
MRHAVITAQLLHQARAAVDAEVVVRPAQGSILSRRLRPLLVWSILRPGNASHPGDHRQATVRLPLPLAKLSRRGYRRSA